ncbi:phosphate ABC transporter substrate-binding protein PstS [Actinotalea sp.]|uniref:phosphate ABC transporter substrate-binding protein PstS n=1 Tax=Actinotalea sp. TaxID=1872145 RepID=UPI002C177159|nr:phosphate ABC transporter substrate-binding protein PstS [Actinotalea sp.]HQY32734.1 phosphate ABC transporter substrate-binding protein PstS [Actinotalea sp.]HRA50282.1 phosphate ABC transporter substrate-binding protein PstS [Actinotalea sp.]
MTTRRERAASRTRRRRSARTRLRHAAAAAGLVALSLLVGIQSPAWAAYGQIEGSGSTWSQVIVDQWIADVAANGMAVTYNGGGSSQGRKNFSANVTDFGISEIPYQGTDEYGNADTAGSREFAYLPIVAGGTAFTYHLEAAGELVRDIRLSGETIAKIFTNQITSWADPAIKADNNGRSFPDTPIVPVVRSDGSGTTAQFTTYLDQQYPSIWRPYFGRSGLTSYYPKPSGTRMIAANGSDQVMNTVASAAGNGTIAYVEYSYPVNKGFPVVKVLNASGFYVEPTQYAVAVALTAAQINTDQSSPLYLTQILDGVYANADPRAYPLSSYSYMLLPTGANDQRMTTNKRQTLVDFMFYSLCEGQGKAGAYGYSPLPLNLVQAGFEQVAKLGAADPAVDVANRDATRCNNPTFVAGDLSRNRLAEVAAAPAACDQAGAGPCLGAGQSADPGGTGTTGGSTSGTTGTVGTTGAAADGAVTADGAAAGVVTIDPETGLPIGDAGTGAGGTASGAVTTAVARPVGGAIAFGGLAALELLAVVLVPGLLLARHRRAAVAP